MYQLNKIIYTICKVIFKQVKSVRKILFNTFCRRYLKQKIREIASGQFIMEGYLKDLSLCTRIYEFTNSPIHEFKVLHKGQSLLKTLSNSELFLIY